MRISDWSSDVCSSDLQCRKGGDARVVGAPGDLLAAKQAIEKRFGRRQRARDRTDDQALERGAAEHSKRGRQPGRRREREKIGRASGQGKRESVSVVTGVTRPIKKQRDTQ